MIYNLIVNRSYANRFLFSFRLAQTSSRYITYINAQFMWLEPIFLAQTIKCNEFEWGANLFSETPIHPLPWHQYREIRLGRVWGTRYLWRVIFFYSFAWFFPFSFLFPLVSNPNRLFDFEMLTISVSIWGIVDARVLCVGNGKTS